MCKIVFLAALVALCEARFSQEQAVAPIVGGLSKFGQPGQAATLAGATPGVLLAGADACAKLTLADKIVAELGNDPQVIDAAKKLCQAEKNFNPFVASVPTICSDPALPATEALRGVIPLVDPAVVGSDIQNTNSKNSLNTPFESKGLSVADIMKNQGFTNFTAQGSEGKGKGATPTGTGATGNVKAANGAKPTATGSASGTGSGAVRKSSIDGLDFGSCEPTMKFEAGLNGRKETEFTFQAIDPTCNKGQQEALKAGIIMRRICDRVQDACGASKPSVDKCRSVMAEVLALGTNDVSTANEWNTRLGFEGTNTNPDNAPQKGLIGHT